MNKRKSIPPDVQTQIFDKSGRRCCVCFCLNSDNTVKKGQVAHLDQNPSNNKFENLAWLCFDHHDEYDSKTSQSKGLQKDEIAFYRDKLYMWREEQWELNAVSSLPIIDAQVRQNRIKLIEGAIKQIDREIGNLRTYLLGRTTFKDKYHYRAVMVYPFEIVAEEMRKLLSASFINYDLQRIVSSAEFKDAEKLVQMLPEVIFVLEAELAKLKYR